MSRVSGKSGNAADADATMIGNHALECQIGQNTIRQIKSDDETDLARRLAEQYRSLEWETAGETAISLSAIYSAERCAYFVIEQQTRIVGGAGIAPLANDLGHIADLQRFVLEPMTAKIGHGVRLLKHCLQAADLMGYRACYAESFSRDSDFKEILRLTGFRIFDTSLFEARTAGCDAIHYFKLGLR